MKRYFIHLAYNGSAYHGWQVQDNAQSVQGVLNDCLTKLLNQPVHVVGCGRTDTGVHARDFYAHFEVENLGKAPSEVAFRMNRFLPPDIVIFSMFEVGQQDHTRFSATARTYQYHVTTRKDPFRTNSHFEVTRKLDVDAMNEAAAILLDYTDFTCFSKSGTDTKTNDCDVTHACWEQSGTELVLTITANRFLRNMVRAVVGTLLEIGKGKLTVADMHRIIESKNRGEAGTSVPAHALYLHRVDYPEHIMNAAKAATVTWPE